MCDRRPCQCKQLSLYPIEVSQPNEVRAFQLVRMQLPIGGEREDVLSVFDRRDRLRKDLNGFLERSQDRALFDLPPRPDPDS